MYTYVNVKGTKKDCYQTDRGKAKNKIHSFLLPDLILLSLLFFVFTNCQLGKL